MKCKSLTIETNGKCTGTKVIIDGQQIGFVQKIEFEVDIDNLPVRALIQVVRRDKAGNPIPKILKVRDEKTLKFIEKKTVELEPLNIEFEALK
jgi:hypothetical protein